VIEVNGDSHFIIGHPDKKIIDLKFKMKMNHLKLFGINKLVPINYYEWEKFDTSNDKKLSYVKNCLENPILIE
jgi:hypothetical protein